MVYLYMFQTSNQDKDKCNCIGNSTELGSHYYTFSKIIYVFMNNPCTDIWRSRYNIVYVMPRTFIA